MSHIIICLKSPISGLFVKTYANCNKKLEEMVVHIKKTKLSWYCYLLHTIHINSVHVKLLNTFQVLAHG